MPSRLRVRQWLDERRGRGRSANGADLASGSQLTIPPVLPTAKSVTNVRLSIGSVTPVSVKTNAHSPPLPPVITNSANVNVNLSRINTSISTKSRSSIGTQQSSLSSSSVSQTGTLVCYTSQAIWDEAYQKLSPNERQTLSRCEPSGLTDSTAVLQAVREKQTWLARERWHSYSWKFGERTYSLKTLMDNVIAWVERFKGIGDIIIQYDPTHIALPWAGVRFLLQIVVEDKANMTTIALILERTTNVIATCSIYIELYLRQTISCAESLKAAVVKLYKRILETLAAAIDYFDKQFRAIRSVTELQKFEDNLTSIDQLMLEVREVVDTAHAEVQNVTNIWQRDTLTKLNAYIAGMENSLETIGLTTEELRRDMKDKNREAIFEWLSPVLQKQQHDGAGVGTLENTGRWLFDNDPKFRNWQDCPKSAVLWVRGKPGAGKTRLTWAGIERERRRNPGEPVMYFYCSHPQYARGYPETILGTLLKQLLRDNSVAELPALKARFLLRTEKGPLNIEELQTFLFEILITCTGATIFIDALDEVGQSDRSQILDALYAIKENEKVKVKIWVSSREEKDIQRKLMCENADEVTMEKLHEGEIREYVEREINRYIDEGNLLDGAVEDSLKEYIINVISEKSEGMYLWAGLHTRGLLGLNRKAHIEETLRSLPVTLEATYDKIYEMILNEPELDKQAALMALNWLICAIRPLSPAELSHAAWLASTLTRPGIKNIRSINDNPDLTTEVLLKLCHNLVDIDKQRNVMRFTHHSVREYLKKKPEFSRDRSHCLVAETCLAYLTYSKSITGAFSKYIIENWAWHCKLATGALSTGSEASLAMKEKISTVINLMRGFLQSCPVYRRWLSCVEEVEFCNDIDPLFVAARYGLSQICVELLSCRSQITDPRNTGGRTPLHVAAQFGHAEVVEIYLGLRNVDVNVTDIDGRTPLAWAVFRGHKAVVKILLMFPTVQVNIPDGLGKLAPLARASWCGNNQMVKLLLKAEGIEVDKRNEFGVTALMWASRRGDVSVMVTLIQHGADINACDKYNRTALSWALIANELDAFALLTRDPKIIVNYKDHNGMTPLYYACKYRTGKTLDKTLKMLLDVPHVDVNSSCYFATPLIVAADGGQHTAVRLLAGARGIKVNDVASKKRTALIIATLNNDKDCVRALLEAAPGLDLRHEDASGKTALVHAVENGSKDIIQLLLIKEGVGVAVSSGLEDLAGNTNLKHQELIAIASNEPASSPIMLPPVLAEESFGAVHVFEIARLASKGVVDAQKQLTTIDVNARSTYGGTALHLAAQYSKGKVGIETLEALLAIPGIHTNAQDQWGKTPLIEAARLGIVTMVSILLQTPGVDPNTRDIRGRTALFSSIRDKIELRRVVDLLLQDSRVDVNATDKSSVTPISQAVHNKATNIASLLLATGKVDVNLVDHMGFTPLTYAAMKGPCEIVKLLLKVPGIDIECQDDRWYTPLALATKYGHKDVVEELVRRGANLGARTNRGLTVLELAEEYGRVEIVEVLNAASAECCQC